MRRKYYSVDVDGKPEGYHEVKRRKRGGYYPIKVKMEVWKRENDLMIQRALSGASPMLVSEIRSLEIRSTKDIERVISGLFPRILEMVGNGDSIATIEIDLSFKARLLSKFLERNPKLNAKIKEVREMRRERMMCEDDIVRDVY